MTTLAKLFALGLAVAGIAASVTPATAGDVSVVAGADAVSMSDAELDAVEGKFWALPSTSFQAQSAMQSLLSTAPSATVTVAKPTTAMAPMTTQTQINALMQQTTINRAQSSDRLSSMYLNYLR